MLLQKYFIPKTNTFSILKKNFFLSFILLLGGTRAESYVKIFFSKHSKKKKNSTNTFVQLPVFQIL